MTTEEFEAELLLMVSPDQRARVRADAINLVKNGVRSEEIEPMIVAYRRAVSLGIPPVEEGFEAFINWVRNSGPYLAGGGG